MAIFDKSDKIQQEHPSGATIIAECAKISGEIDTTCSLHIDGRFDGNIKSTNVVTIGKTGYAKGEIKSSSLIVSGVFEGNVDCDIVEILPDGRIKGKILSKELVIEKKGFFEGESKKKEAEGVIKKKEPLETKI
jgi:cytoskeletal protein CcmA (bactofilin family)